MAKVTCSRCGIVERGHICPKKICVRDSCERNRQKNNRADKKIYRTKAWADLRKGVLLECNYVCLWSLYVHSEILTAECCHHILEVLEFPDLALRSENVIALNGDSHNRIHFLYSHKNKEKCIELLKKCKTHFCEYGLRVSDIGIFKYFDLG